MKKPGWFRASMIQGKHPTGPIPAGARTPCLAMHSPTKLRMALLSHTTLCCTRRTPHCHTRC